MKKLLILLFFLFLSSYPLFSEDRKNVFSLDFGWSTEGLSNEGYGFGIAFERVLWDFLSFKLRHGVVETYKNRVGNRVDSYVFSLLLSYNSFCKGLAGFSIALGYGYDLVIVTKPSGGETLYSFLIPFVDTMASYKFIFDRLFIEPYVEFMIATGDVERQKTGIAMDTSYVNIIGLNLGITY